MESEGGRPRKEGRSEEDSEGTWKGLGRDSEGTRKGKGKGLGRDSEGTRKGKARDSEVQGSGGAGKGMGECRRGGAAPHCRGGPGCKEEGGREEGGRREGGGREGGREGGAPEGREGCLRGSAAASGRRAQPRCRSLTTFSPSLSSSVPSPDG